MRKSEESLGMIRADFSLKETLKPNIAVAIRSFLPALKCRYINDSSMILLRSACHVSSLE